MNDRLSRCLAEQKSRYIKSCEEDGGTCPGFLQHVSDLAIKEPERFELWKHEALMEAARSKWQAQPRKHGDDLFSIAKVPIPEHLTRPARNYHGGLDEENAFEKVDSDFATVNDLREHGILHMRIAAQTASAAEKQLEAADEALKRAKGNLQRRLRDIADKVDNS